MCRHSEPTIPGMLTAACEERARGAGEVDEALRLSEERFLTLAEATGQLVWWADAHGNVVGDLPQWRSFTGQSVAEIQGDGWTAALHPEDRKRIVAIWSQESVKPCRYEAGCRIRHQDGAYRDTSIRAVPVLAADGSVREWIGTCVDVTERKQVERAAQDSGQQLHTLLDTLPQKICVKDCQSVYLLCNRAYAADLHLTPDEVVGKTDLDFYPRDLAEKYRADDLRVMQSGASVELEEAYLRNNEERIVSTVKVPVRDERGTVTGVLVLFWDITERKRAAERSSILAAIVAASGDAIIAKRLDGTVISWNAAAEREYGYSEAEMIGRSIELLEPPERRGEIRRVLQSIGQGDSIRSFETTRLRKDGRPVDVAITVSPVLDGTGAIAMAATIAHDIGDLVRLQTQLRRTSHYNRSLLEAALDPLVTISPDGRITDVNDATVRATGVVRDQIIGTEFSSYFTDPERARAGYQQVLRDGYVRDYSLDLRHADGPTISVLYNATTFRDETGALMGVFAAARDVTSLKRAEQEIVALNRDLERRVQERTAQLEAAIKELEGFSYSVSHDLRVPLRAIDGFSRKLERQYSEQLDDEGHRIISVVRTNSQRMGKLIEDVLAFSRLGRKDIERKQVNMTELARDVAEELAPSHAGRDLVLVISELPPVLGDPAMLRQVWINLLSNAIKFTRLKPAARIEVSGHVEDTEVVYCVKDDGVGFDMQYVEKLFGIFQRLHGYEEFEGTGAGLSIVKRIVTRHGGRAWAEGKVDEGATFWFALPMAGNEAEPASASVSPKMEVLT